MATIVASSPEPRIVRSGISWRTYKQILSEVSDRGRPHFARLRGMLKIGSPAPPHKESGIALSTAVMTLAE